MPWLPRLGSTVLGIQIAQGGQCLCTWVLGLPVLGPNTAEVLGPKTVKFEGQEAGRDDELMSSWLLFVASWEHLHLKNAENDGSYTAYRLHFGILSLCFGYFGGPGRSQT